MAEQEPTPEQLEALAAANDEPENPLNYKPPAAKSLQEIQELDQDDESLRKPHGPNVQVIGMTLKCETAPHPLVLDLTGDLTKFKKSPFVLKEGVEYRIQINFKVNKDIVSGMKYTQQSFRGGIKVEKSDYMVGSYGPRPSEEYTYDAPKGMIARGTYTIKSKFTDDDKHDHLSWEWCIAIKKDWTE
ncbi:hypothetical protein F7725_003705 [Dissostichus mawsoni]|uniref:Rho GDP-dissociation inhibitor 1 n=1 Tax=Dissostichus mawsoni TaxID=36200 RepID=A0A7J5YDL8_DISMA|nr:hypothetical protein F7725_003705 [Dissostichus mawsoni]